MASRFTLRKIRMELQLPLFWLPADLHSPGLVWHLAVQEISSEIEDSDETGLLFALSNRGISILDASQSATIAGAVPLANAPAATPSSGPNVDGTALTLSGKILLRIR
jgi:hypothetical protein